MWMAVKRRHVASAAEVWPQRKFVADLLYNLSDVYGRQRGWTTGDGRWAVLANPEVVPGRQDKRVTTGDGRRAERTDRDEQRPAGGRRRAIFLGPG